MDDSTQRRTPESLHPALWRADQLGGAARAGLPTGFPALDAELPGAGWPIGALTELLLPHPGVGELRLLAPALVAVMTGQGGTPETGARSVMLFDPPAEPCAWALAALGIDVRRLLLVRGRDGLRGRARSLLPAADTLWALEQALRSGVVGAVLAWLPTRMRGELLRRLQLAAQTHPGPVFVLREVEARSKPSAAPLRLVLGAAAPDQLRLRVLKRRGAPLAEPLLLALPPVLSATARGRASARGHSTPADSVPA